MTKKKRIITRLLVVLAALTLISCCFLGTTFARYTSSNSGKASVTVAKWEISMTGTGVGTTAASFGDLSPSKEAYDSTTADTAPRSHATAKTLVATIENKSDVGVVVTVTAGAATFYDNATTPAKITDATLLGKAQSVLSVKLYYTTKDTPTASDYTEITTTPTQTTITLVDANAASGDKKVYIYAEAVWTSQDTSSQNGDAIDTAVGEGVSKMEVPVTYTATQNTQIPA